jgi:hypothetical protein
MTSKDLNGAWTYRSFINNPQQVGNDPQKALSLIFGEGALTITATTPDQFKADLDFGGGAGMDLFGEFYDGHGVNPPTLIITGAGRTGTPTEKWVYQYKGYVVPHWPEGSGQVATIVGTTIRTIPHDGGTQQGYVASFVIVKN